MSKVKSFKHLTIVLVIVLGSLGASAQVLRGTVINGTTKKPAGGEDVVLLRLDKGMDEEARTKANARGEFSFELPDSQTVRAVRVRHQNVNYFQPVPPGTSSVAVTVYESAPAVQGVHRTEQSVVFQAQGNMLQGFEIFNVNNDSQPPRTQPAFDFYLPEGATVDSATAFRQGGMPLKVGPVPQSGNKYLIMYPLLPGQTHFEVVYKMSYSGTLKYQPRFAGPVAKFYVATPKSMGFAPDSPTQYQSIDAQTIAPDLKGMDLHVASNIGDEKQLAFQIAGEGLIPQESGQQASNENQGNSRQEAGESTRPGGGLGVPNERPNPLSSAQPLFLVILALFMAGGAAFIFVTARSGGTAPVKAQGQAAPLLDALKEEMFQLEADRVQGKVSGHDYEAAKSALDKTLQRAMRKKQ